MSYVWRPESEIQATQRARWFIRRKVPRCHKVNRYIHQSFKKGPHSPSSNPPSQKPFIISRWYFFDLDGISYSFVKDTPYRTISGQFLKKINEGDGGTKQFFWTSWLCSLTEIIVWKFFQAGAFVLFSMPTKFRAATKSCRILSNTRC